MITVLVEAKAEVQCSSRKLPRRLDKLQVPTFSVNSVFFFKIWIGNTARIGLFTIFKKKIRLLKFNLLWITIPSGVDSDPDPIFKKKRIRIRILPSRNNRIRIRPSKNNLNFVLIKFTQLFAATQH